MNKTIIFSILLAISGIVKVNAQTYVSGGIYTDTTWTAPNSPYIVTDALTIFQGATLTIEPGVEVRFDDSILFDVRGKLIANGTEDDSISFISNDLIPTQQSWLGISLHTELNATFDLSFCRFMHATHAIYIYNSGTPPNSFISYSLFENNVSGIEGAGGWNFLGLNNCSFVNNTYGIGGDAGAGNMVPTGCRFVNNFIGIAGTSGVNPVQCSFCGNNRALAAWWCIVTECSITNNTVGIDETNATGYYELIKTTIAYNDTGIILHPGSASSDIFTSVNLCSNTSYNVVHTGIYNYNMSNICWCDTNEAYISQKIYDGYDNVAYGLINYTPILNCDTIILPDESPCSAPTGIALIEENKNAVEIFPNPMQNYSIVKSMKELDDAQITVSNLMGQIVLKLISQSGTQFTIYRQNLPDGLYFLNITEHGKAVCNLKFSVM